ncbi:MAG: ABC transporter substrate-binding protein, partial [Candidatus Sifarchaeia archaeon]
MERNQLIAVVVIIVVVGSVGAYILLAPPAITLAEDQTIVMETIALPQYLDPHKDYESAGSHVSLNVYETLYTYPWDTADTTPSVPLLATDVEISSDGMTYTFTLRQGVTFHDGTPFNASAVQMNFWRMMGRGWDDGFGPVWMVAEPILGGQAVEDAVFEYGDLSAEHIAAWENWVANVSAVVVTGDYEVEINLAYPFAPFLPAITYEVGAMISPTYFMAHGGMSPESDDFWMDDHMCGTGPFIFDEWIDNDRLTIVRNEDYW